MSFKMLASDLNVIYIMVKLGMKPDNDIIVVSLKENFASRWLRIIGCPLNESMKRPIHSQRVHR